MSQTNGKFLFTTTVKDWRTNHPNSPQKDLEVGVYGIFQSEKIEPWTYYAIAYEKSPFTLSAAIGSCGYNQPNATINDIAKTGIKFNTEREAQKYIEDFKTKWETGSNITTAEQRDKKIEDILKDTKV